MIEQKQQILLDAIKASLFGITFSYPKDTDWNAVIEEAKSQTVMRLISQVIPVHDESSDQGKAYYMRLLHEQDKLIKLFDENNIPCVILKGCAAAMYYPKPYLRSMGDVDFLVRHDQFEEAIELMESNGYAYMHGKDENGKLIKGDRHIAYVKNGIEFELHHHFSSIGFNIDEILEKAINKREFRELNGYCFPVLPEIENGLVLLGHMHHHLKNDNLGLRQIIDWEMYFKSVMDNEKWEKEFAPIVKKIGLLELAINSIKMCEKHLGLSKKVRRIDSIQDDSADELLENLLIFGNFGRKQSRSLIYSGNIIREVFGIIKKKGLYCYFQDNGLNKWELCKKHPKLKPFAFIYGFFRFCIRGTKGIVKAGKMAELIRYIRYKNKFDNDLGIRTEDSKNEND